MQQKKAPLKLERIMPIIPGNADKKFMDVFSGKKKNAQKQIDSADNAVTLLEKDLKKLEAEITKVNSSVTNVDKFGEPIPIAKNKRKLLEAIQKNNSRNDSKVQDRKRKFRKILSQTRSEINRFYVSR
jgi:chromosome segregation ATPase